MTRIELNAIRRKLRDLNLEYSALLRDRFGEGRFARMAKLRAERNALVSLIAEYDGRETGTARHNGRLPARRASLSSPGAAIAGAAVEKAQSRSSASRRISSSSHCSSAASSSDCLPASAVEA